MMKRLFSLALLLLLVLVLSGFAPPGNDPITSLDQLKTGRVGVPSGSMIDELVEEVIPGAELIYINTAADAIASLQSGRTDGFAVDELIARQMCAENEGLTMLDELLDFFEYGFVFPKTEKGEKLCLEFSEWLASMKERGELERLIDTWVLGGEEEKTLPDIGALPGGRGTLTLATEGGTPPLNYYRGTEVVGIEVDMAVRFCEAYGYALKIQTMSFPAILPSIQSEKADFGACSISITPERRESVNFSLPYYTGGTVMVVRKGEERENKILPWDFNGKRAGVITGSFHDSVIQEELPDSTLSQYNGYPDLVAALKAHKIDFFLASTEVAANLTDKEEELIPLPDPIRVLDIGAMFDKSPRGEELKAQMDAFIEEMRADGTLEEIYAYWSDPAHDSTPVDMDGLTGENGVLSFATSGTKVPISFVANGRIAGRDPDIAVRFCRRYGYDIEVNIVDTSGIIPGIVTGMYDFSLSDMVITEERKESVNFSLPYQGTNLLVVTLRDALTEGQEGAEVGKEEETGEEREIPALLGDISSSFHKTFLREGRWRLFVDGILTTLLITALSMLFGTALGFVLFMLCRRGNPVAVSLTRLCLWLVQGMPMVVLLMILYYVVFGSLAIPGITVAVIGFTLTFGGGVYGLLKMGVGAVDPGQGEAALALGYSDRKVLFRIILPQALPHVLPAYKGESVGLLKATAVVGYIAVQDLTKMGDIVRSRTYEAFFPLIAVTIIYFVLEGLIGVLIHRIQARLSPRRRRAEVILKGIRREEFRSSASENAEEATD